MNDLDIAALGQLMQRKANEARLWQQGADYAVSLQRAIESARDADSRAKSALAALADATAKYDALVPQFEERTKTLTAEFETKRKECTERLQALRSEIAMLTADMEKVRASRQAEIDKITAERDAARVEAEREQRDLEQRTRKVREALENAKREAAAA